MENHRLIPEEYRFLSGSGLKLLAVAAMLLDHIAHCFLQNDPTILVQAFGRSLTLYRMLRILGRLAFPLYAFLLVEGFHHTRDRNKYGLRLLIFALLSEIPWNLMLSGSLFYGNQNVLFTLLLGYAGLCVIEQLEHGESRRRNLALLFALFVFSILLRADYGCSGFGFILLLHLLRSRPVYRALIGSCILSSRWMAGLAFVPIGFYNGRRGFIRGRVFGLLFYAFYPLHMLILYLIKRSVGG